MLIDFYPPSRAVPKDIFLPEQVHGTKIIEVVEFGQDLSACDGIWSSNPDFILGIKTADCAPICLWDNDKVGVFHAGWRGFIDGIIEEALTIFEGPQAWVGPFYHVFEIQPDECAQRIEKKFGTQFFLQENHRLLFDFKGAIEAILPDATFDQRSTFDDHQLASWRRNQTPLRNITSIKKFEV